MPSDPRRALRFLLDEHYPGTLAAALTDDGLDVVALVTDPQLRGIDDTEVLKLARSEGRIVVTEDISTFGFAAAEVPDHVGIVYCVGSRFPRTPSGLDRLRIALRALAAAPPSGLGRIPTVHWLTTDR